MLILQAIILGAVQGLTEFIPVSSTGHLIAVPALFGWRDLGLAFGVAVHMGTLVAVVIYFRRDWGDIISDFAAHHLKGRPYGKDTQTGASGRLLIPILVACVPAAVAGYLWNDLIENALREWYLVAAALVAVGIVMLLAEKVGKKKRDVERMNYVDYITIGVAQALALFPGVSRSGITISAGLFRNLDRAAAARFSFLLSTPIIFGAGLKEGKDVLDQGLPSGEALLFVAGFASAAIFGYIAIRFLMNYLRRCSLNIFVAYRVALATFLALVFLSRG